MHLRRLECGRGMPCGSRCQCRLGVHLTFKLGHGGRRGRGGMPVRACGSVQCTYTTAAVSMAITAGARASARLRTPAAVVAAFKLKRQRQQRRRLLRARVPPVQQRCHRPPCVQQQQPRAGACCHQVQRFAAAARYTPGVVMQADTCPAAELVGAWLVNLWLGGVGSRNVCTHKGHLTAYGWSGGLKLSGCMCTHQGRSVACQCLRYLAEVRTRSSERKRKE